MAHQSRASGPGDPGMAPDHRPGEGMPRWVKVSVLVVLLVAVLAVILLLLGGPGDHGPGRHGLAAGSSVLVLAHGHVPST